MVQPAGWVERMDLDHGNREKTTKCTKKVGLAVSIRIIKKALEKQFDSNAAPAAGCLLIGGSILLRETIFNC